MRKIIAVLLTVLMIASVLAALPASAATYDGSTTTNEPTLFISEVAAYTQYFAYEGALGSNSHALDFLEIYNNGTTAVDLTDVSILRGVHYYSPAEDESIFAKLDPDFPADGPYYAFWAQHKKFLSKVDIQAGQIIEDEIADKYGKFVDADNDLSNGITNDNAFKFLTNTGVSTSLEAGKNAIIWFVNEATVDWISAEYGKDFDFNPRDAFLKNFYPNLAATEYANYQILMVWGWGDSFVYDDPTNGIVNGNPATNMFYLGSMPAYNENNCDYILALADSDWDLYEDTYLVSDALNTKLYSMNRFGTMRGALTNNYARLAEATSATFIPANKTPYIPNVVAKFVDEDAAQYTDYHKAGIVQSYYEMGIISWDGREVTPGTMPAWQWAMFNPGHANAPDSLKTSGAADATKVATVLTAYVDAIGYGEDDSTSDRVEADKGDIYFESQEDIANRFNNANKKTEEEKSWFEENLVLVIIIAAVVVLGGAAAVVVFVVILPKKKKAAAAAAAAAEVDAPVEEAPAEDAPTTDVQE